MAGYVFPQFNDYDDPENFAFHLGQSNLTEFVEFGIDITADFGAETISITEGKAFVSVDTRNGSASNETRHRLGYGVFIESESGIALDTSQNINYVWLVPNVDTQDTPQISVTTVDTAPSEASIKIAEVDRSNETVQQLNRGMNLVARSIRATNDVYSQQSSIAEQHNQWWQMFENNQELYDYAINDPELSDEITSNKYAMRVTFWLDK